MTFFLIFVIAFVIFILFNKFALDDVDNPKTKSKWNNTLSNESHKRKNIGLSKNNTENTKSKHPVGSLVKHRKRPELETGKVVQCHNDGRCDVEFPTEKFTSVNPESFGSVAEVNEIFRLREEAEERIEEERLRKQKKVHAKLKLLQHELEVKRTNESKVASASTTVELAHSNFLKRMGKENRGVRRRVSLSRRVTHCYSCKKGLDNSIDLECNSCQWILCRCGACGCGYF